MNILLTTSNNVFTVPARSTSYSWSNVGVAVLIAVFVLVAVATAIMFHYKSWIKGSKFFAVGSVIALPIVAFSTFFVTNNAFDQLANSI